MTNADVSWDSMVTVGRIVRPHGNRGSVVVESETDFPAERFAIDAELCTRAADGLRRLRVTSSRPYVARWVVGFEGVETIDAAERLRGLELRVPAATLRPLPQGAYYTHDLVGCRVESADGSVVGEVEGVMFGTGAPLLVVGSGDDEVLVPLAEHICRLVDVRARRIVIEPPAGLIELNRRSRDR